MTAADIAPSAVFLAGYSAWFSILSYLFATKQIGWKSRYLFVYIHVILRLCGMGLGVAFGALTWDQLDTRINVLIAYLVFSAEGYFTLVLCAYRFLIVWQNDRIGVSNLEPHIAKGTPFKERWRLLSRSPMAGVHWGLIAANAVIISGSSILAGSIDKSSEDGQQKENSAKALRVAGTAVFLALVQLFLLVALHSYRRRNPSGRGRAGDRTLILIMTVWPLLTVRGVYGIISVLIPAYSYYSADIYTDSGFSTTFIVGEHVLGTLMEWSACGLLISTHFSAFNGGAELTEVWGEAPRGLATGAEEEEKEFQHLGRRRSSEVATEV